MPTGRSHTYKHLPKSFLRALLPGATYGNDRSTSAGNTLQRTGNKNELCKFHFSTQLKPTAFDSAELINTMGKGN